MWKFIRKNEPLKSLDLTLDIYRRHSDNDVIAYPMGEGSSSIREIEAIAKKLSVRFPDELIAHLSGSFPGIYVCVKETIWPGPKALDVGPFWAFLYGVHTFSPLTTSLDWMRLDIAGEEFQRSTKLMAAPILKIVGDANVICVDADGKLREFDHEQNSLSPLEDSFWTIVDRELSKLFERKKRYVTEQIGPTR